MIYTFLRILYIAVAAEQLYSSVLALSRTLEVRFVLSVLTFRASAGPAEGKEYN